MRERVFLAANLHLEDEGGVAQAVAVEIGGQRQGREAGAEVGERVDQLLGFGRRGRAICRAATNRRRCVPGGSGVPCSW